WMGPDSELRAMESTNEKAERGGLSSRAPQRLSLPRKLARKLAFCHVDGRVSSRPPKSGRMRNFPPEKVRRLADKIERHHTPKLGSWLNIAEIEISALSRTTLPDRVGSLDEFRRRCPLGVSRRNEENVVTNWRLTNKNARIKFKRLYPSIEE
ncbi:MAG: hypothetical protein ACI8T1_003710, partial [Verrucomicrobiales bacterium]